MLAAVLSARGCRTGLFTSPHLCSLRERYQVDAMAVPEDRLTLAADEVRELVAGHGLTFFEAATVLGLHLFAREQVDVTVVEVGLGGRLDATNVIQPMVSVVTNVALDHTEYLGSSLAEIAAEKAGIAKPGVPFVTAETDPELLAVFRGVCVAIGAPFHALDRECIRDVEVAVDHTSFTMDTRSWGQYRLTTRLVGEHQATNAALAVAALERLPAELHPAARDVSAGVSAVRWPGRGQVEEIDGCTWLFDVAHNPAGVRSLVELVDRVELPRPLVALVGVLADKQWREMLLPVLRRADRAILTQPPSATPERRWDPSEAERALRPVLREGYPLTTDEDFPRALAAARRAAGKGTVVVTGSCHTVGDALRLVGRCPLWA